MTTTHARGRMVAAFLWLVACTGDANEDSGSTVDLSDGTAGETADAADADAGRGTDGGDTTAASTGSTGGSNTGADAGNEVGGDTGAPGPVGEWMHEGTESRVYAPPGVHDGPAKLFLVFHGAEPPSFGNHVYTTMVQQWKSILDRENIVVVGPTGGRVRTTWTPPQGAETDSTRRTRDILDAMRGAYNIDDTAVYILGFSDGAAMSILTGNFMSDTFAAIVAVDLGIGGCNPGVCGPTTDYKVPLYMTYSSVSQLGSYMPPMADWYRSQGHDVEIIEFGGIPHGNMWIESIANKPNDVWSWLSTKRHP